MATIGVDRSAAGDSVRHRDPVAGYGEQEEQQQKVEAQLGAKQELKEAYTQGKRNFEIACLSTFMLMITAVIGALIWNWRLANPILVTIAIFGGILTADFGSGFVHWLCDSYGSVDMPVLGRAFIRSFREHHVDPAAITHHDVIECNADNCMTMLPCLAFMCHNLAVYDETVIAGRYHLFVFFSWLAFFVAFTNQFHKWSHTYGQLPRWVEVLQNYQIILPKRHHKIHHIAPHATYFCITTGWLNHPLEYVGFWTGIEKVIEITTGYRARDDDLSWASKAK